MRDPHSVLGIAPTASRAQIKAAYRTLAKQWHPDRHDGDHEAKARFVEIGDAYRQLSRNGMDALPTKKRRSHRTGPNRDAVDKPENGASPPPVSADDAAMMERIFGVVPDRMHVEDTPDLDSVEPDADTASTAVSDTGASEDKGTNRKSVKRALHAIFSRRRAIAGTERTTGTHADRQTRTCEAEIFDIEVPLHLIATGGTLDVTTPDGTAHKLAVARGTANGARLTLPPVERRADSAGAAQATVRYAACDILWHDGNGLNAVLAIDLDMAVLGGVVRFATFDGAIRLTIPPWSGSDRVLKVAGRGLPASAEGPRDDLLVHLRVLLASGPESDLVALMKARRQGVQV